MLGLGIVGTIIVIVVVVWLVASRVIRLGVQSSWSGVGPLPCLDLAFTCMR